MRLCKLVPEAGFFWIGELSQMKSKKQLARQWQLQPRLAMMCLCTKSRLRPIRIGDWCLGRGQRVGGVVIGSCSLSTSGFRWRAPSSSSGAGSSCSCKAPVLRQPMKGVWKLSITRLPSRPHPWDSFPVSPLVAWPPLVYLPIHPAVRPSGIPSELPAMYSWLFLYTSLTIGKIALG